MRQDKTAFLFASESLRKHRQFMQEAMRLLGWKTVLPDASEELRGNKDFIKEAASQDVHALQWASEELKRDDEFLSKVIDVGSDHGGMHQYATLECAGQALRVQMRRRIMEEICGTATWDRGKPKTIDLREAPPMLWDDEEIPENTIRGG